MLANKKIKRTLLGNIALIVVALVLYLLHYIPLQVFVGVLVALIILTIGIIISNNNLDKDNK